MESKQIIYMNTTTLAFLGDAVYETYVREFLINTGNLNADRLHNGAVKYVRAEAQAQALKELLDILSEEEMGLVKRARNKRSMTKAKNADPVLYKWATAFEALVGYLYLSGHKERLEEIICLVMERVRQNNGEKEGKK